MTALAFASATTHGAVRRAAKAAGKVLARIRSAFLRLAALIAEARIHKARLEAELYLNRYRLRTKTDDDLPVIR
jgi:hypothetical protein